MMTALMSSSSGLSMRLLWHPEVPHMKLRVFQFDRLLAQNLPRLHVHFRKIRLAPDILVTQWLMTLLAYILPLRVVVRTWDVVFLDGMGVCVCVYRCVCGRGGKWEGGDRLIDAHTKDSAFFFLSFYSFITYTLIPPPIPSSPIPLPPPTPLPQDGKPSSASPSPSSKPSKKTSSP
jgi:hypothetical protein